MESIENKIDIESEKGDVWGNNVILDIQLVRHGKKASFNAARIENPDEVKKAASEFDLSSYDYVGVRTTPVERAVDTAQWAREGYKENPTVKNKEAVKVRIKKLSSGILSESGTVIKDILKDTENTKDLNLISPDIREKYKEAVLAAPDSDWEKENAGVNAFIEILESEIRSIPTALHELDSNQDFSEQALQEIEALKTKQLNSGGISILEVALRMGSHLEKYARLTQHLKNESKVFFYEVNHSGFIEPDLVYLLKEQIESNPVNPDGQTILEKIGGAFEPSEGVKISIKREQRDGSAMMIFEIRGKQYTLEVSGQTDKLTKSKRLLDAVGISEKILSQRHGEN